MNASVEWLSAFVESGLTPHGLRDLITARAATVDEVVPLRSDLTGVVVGSVVAATRHPDSDHLWLATVDAGGPEPLTVVCGAPNVTVGVQYPFAPVGTTMPSGMTIERRKIRGHASSGMLCSARELGLGEEHEGILPLATDARPGTPIDDVLSPGDTRLVIDVGPNRPDLLSHLGVAREIAAATGRPLRADATRGPTNESPAPVPPAARSAGTGTTDSVRVTVEDAADCPAYLGVVLRDVRVGPSPAWLAARLAAVGVRSISNVVDVTNYMLHGYGQPMHAFDLGRLSGNQVRVRRARPGERLLGLDGVDRALDGTMLVIADAERVQAVAGVIGGQGSEVTPATTDVFLEVAAFSPSRVRATRRALGLTTDASYRFERLVPESSPAETYDKAVRLLLQLTGGRLAAAPVLVAPAPTPRSALSLRTRRVAQVLGVAVPADECARLLASVGFKATPTAGGLTVRPPTWREWAGTRSACDGRAPVSASWASTAWTGRSTARCW
jgi:phenylalanyl-tRNA synthetase beta chain